MLILLFPQISRYFYETHPEHNISLQLKWVSCDICGAHILNTEAPGFCCGKGGKGDPVLVTIPEVPEALKKIYEGSADLRKNSRKYNNIFSMSAIGATGSFETKKTGGSNLILHGRTYHRMLNGNDESGPLRWFLNDGEYARASVSNIGADLNIVEKLRAILVDCNPLLQQFKRLAEEPSEDARLELTISSNQEIAAIIIPDRNGVIKKKTIVCWKKSSNKPTFIEATNPLYMPLHYILVCPYGTSG